jgi:RimJ/RimL family protein N-acetyltransferase
MEKLPYQADLEALASPEPIEAPACTSREWRNQLPVLTGPMVTLRELRMTDAPVLLATLTTDAASGFISPPPASVEGFERFIAWSHRQRAAGQYITFAVVPRGSEIPIGIFQVRSLDPSFSTCEWGFTLAEEFWGSGIFLDGARLVLNFAVHVLGAHRIEARAAVKNGRGNAALRKLGAVQESVLRRSFLRNGEYLDQALWTILAEDWVAEKAIWGASVVH